uniref:Uncharacterized protein n=1 Tax=Zea mays TaxID=4577 RepID=A0A804R597_MAIZE
MGGRAMVCVIDGARGRGWGRQNTAALLEKVLSRLGGRPCPAVVAMDGGRRAVAGPIAAVVEVVIEVFIRLMLRGGFPFVEVDDELDDIMAPLSDVVPRTTRESSALATTMRSPFDDGQRGAAALDRVQAAAALELAKHSGERWSAFRSNPTLVIAGIDILIGVGVAAQLHLDGVGVDNLHLVRVGISNLHLVGAPPRYYPSSSQIESADVISLICACSDLRIYLHP